MVLVDNLEGLAGRLLGGSLGVRLGLVAVVEVGLELVGSRDIEELLEGLLDRRDGVQVLEVGAETLKLERGPDEDLVHAGSVVAPFAEHVGRGSVSLLSLLGDGSVLPEDDL